MFISLIFKYGEQNQKDCFIEMSDLEAPEITMPTRRSEVHLNPTSPLIALHSSPSTLHRLQPSGTQIPLLPEQGQALQ